MEYILRKKITNMNNLKCCDQRSISLPNVYKLTINHEHLTAAGYFHYNVCLYDGISILVPITLSLCFYIHFI